MNHFAGPFSTDGLNVLECFVIGLAVGQRN